MRAFLALAVCFLTVSNATVGAAATFQNSTGLVSPVSVEDFEGSGLSDGTLITNQFSGFTFAPGLSLNSQGGGPFSFPGITGDYVGNNAQNPFVNPFSILFDSNQTAVGLGYATNPATTTITALLNGVFVEAAAFVTDFSTNGFFGFTGILFNEIQISVGGDQQILLDNLQSGSMSPVPLPASVLFLLAGFGGLSLIRRRHT